MSRSPFPVLCVLLAIAFAAPILSLAQPPRRDHGYSVVFPDLPLGKSYLEVTVSADGKASVVPLSVATMAPLPTPGPTPTPTPTPTPSDLTARAKEIKALAEAVRGDPERQATALGLAAMYRELAKTARTGQVADKATLFEIVKMGTGMFLLKNPGDWTPVRDKFAVQWSQVPANGGMVSYADLLDEVASGLEASAPNRAIDPAMWALILQIIELIMKLLNK